MPTTLPAGCSTCGTQPRRRRSSFTYTYDDVGNRTQVIEFMTWPGPPKPVASRTAARVAQAPEPLGLSLPVDPLTAGLAPFGLLMLLPLARRRRLSHPTLLVVLVILAGMALSVSACGPIPTLPPRPDTHLNPNANAHAHSNRDRHIDGYIDRHRDGYADLYPHADT